MIHEKMNISHLMVHAKNVEAAKSMRKSRDAKGQDLLMEVLR